MVRVKICGIRTPADAECALAAGADALGFVFAESPRRIQVKEARGIVKAVGPWIVTVGVFVNQSLGIVKRTAEECGLDAVQLHGDEPPSYARQLGGFRKVIKAFRVGRTFASFGAESYPADAFLFDAKRDDRFGGTGKTFEWELLKGRKFGRPLILSGGLDPRNVKRAVRILSPYGVDVSSGVESSPGKKDPRLVKEFIRNAKEESN